MCRKESKQNMCNTGDLSRGPRVRSPDETELWPGLHDLRSLLPVGGMLNTHFFKLKLPGDNVIINIIGMCGLSLSINARENVKSISLDIWQHKYFIAFKPCKNCYLLHDNMANTNSIEVGAIDSEYFAIVFAKRDRCCCAAICSVLYRSVPPLTFRGTVW